MSSVATLLHRICAFVDQPLLILNSSHQVIEANEALCEIIGVPASRIQEYDVFDLPDGSWNGQELRTLLERSASSRDVASTEDIQWTLGPVGCRTIRVSVSPIRPAPDSQESLLLLTIKQRSDPRSALRSQFLANISHELYTPMTAVLGMVQLSLQEDLLPSVRKYLNTAEASANALLSLINDMLDFAGLESGKIVMVTEPFSLRELLDQTSDPHARLAHSKGLGWRLSVAPEVPDELVGDSIRLRQVIDHLLSNAAKFTARGCVEVYVGLGDSAPADGASLLVSVSDTGPGLSPEDQARMLEGFTQLDSSFTRPHGGAGLGLAICRVLIERLGGQMSIESHLGEGSRFEFTAPFKLQESSALERRQDATNTSAPSGDKGTDTPHGLCVLLAEDTPANQKVIGGILRKRGHDVTIVANGREALEQVAKTRFNVILMDLQMPVMDGYQATAAIQEIERMSGSHTPIIALTAHSTEEDRGMCLQAGMEAYLAKPIDVAELIATVESTARRESETPTATTENTTSMLDGSDHAEATSAVTIDLAATMKRLGGDRDLFRQFVEVFHEDSPRLHQQLTAAIAKGECKSVVRAAHSLRGLAANFGASFVVDLASQIEAAANQEDLTDAAALSQRLSDAIGDLSAELESQRIS